MKKSSNKTLKILIEHPSISALDMHEFEQWENEGGMTRSSSNFLQSLIPVKKGEIFEVIGGDVHDADGKIYFEAEIKLLALP